MYRRCPSHSEDVCMDDLSTMTETRNPEIRREGTFCRRECVKFCATETDDSKCKCGRSAEVHPMYNGRESDWKPETHTKTSETDAFGELEFQGPLTLTRAKYVRLSHDTKAEDVWELLTEKWRLKKPKLVIEVTGGAKDFVLQPKLMRIFRKGIIKVAVSTDAWIFTGGTNTGVMRHVGMAVREHTLRSRQKINVIGVVTWGIINNRNDLIKRPSSTRENTSLKDNSMSAHAPRVKHYPLTSSDDTFGASLDPNHTHFILVDDGSVEKYGVEIPLRSNLEKFISSTEIDPNIDCLVPAVCVCLEGGKNTIRTVLENVTHEPPIPVVIVEGSGRAADLIAYAYRNSSQEGQISSKIQKELKKKISDVFPDVGSAHTDLFEQLLKLITERKVMITIFSEDSDDNVDSDFAILSPILKANNRSLFEQLKLSLIWNRVDIAKELIFKEVTSLEVKRQDQEPKLTESELKEAMDIALKKNRVQFVTLLLENGFSMETFLTDDQLKSLYNTVERDHSPTIASLSRYANINITKDGQINLKDIGLIIEDLLGGGFESEYARQGAQTNNDNVTDHACGKTEPEAERRHHYNDLFIWAILTKKHDMAYLMWKRGQEFLPMALVGFRLFHSMARFARSRHYTNAANQLTEQSSRYEKLAVTLLTQCFEEDAKKTRRLLCLKLPNWSQMSCLSLAANFNHSRFIAHPSVQLLLNDYWYYGPENTTKYDDEDDGVGQGEVTSGSKPGHTSDANDSTSIMSRKKKAIFTAPIVKFWINAMFYFMFLIAFSYVVLMELKPNVGLVEWLVVLIVFSLATEEIRQLVMQGDSETLTFRQRAKIWASNWWNLCDLVGILTFALGFFIRLWEGGLTSGRMFYILDIMVWYVRVLDILSVIKWMGPYVNMIGKMMNDTAKFIVILFVFLVSYGVASNALMSPMKEWDWNVLRDIVYIPYWQIYGETFIDRQDDFITNCSLFPRDDMELCDVGIVLERLITGIYILIANVLLVNMLIAIFNNTFSTVQENANEIWKFQRYRLIMEFSERPFLPPPFILICHVQLLLKKIMASCCPPLRTKHPTPEDIHEQKRQDLYRFEKDIVENHLRKNALTEQQSLKGTIEHMSERMDSFIRQTEKLCRNDAE